MASHDASGLSLQIGLALLDLEDLQRLSDGRRMGSTNEPYERVGDVGDVVFPCASRDAKTREVRIIMAREPLSRSQPEYRRVAGLAENNS